MNENLVHRKEIMEREVGKEHMLYDALGKVVHVLNETAFFVWQRCDGKHTTQDIVREVCSLSGTAEDLVRGDVEQCMATFREKGLLQGKL